MKENIKPLPQEYKTRPATMADISIVVELINFGATHTSVEEKKNAWETPGLDISKDTHLVFSGDELLVGLLEFWDISEPHVQPTIHLHVHPEKNPLLVGNYLLSWADKRAKQVLEIAPPDEKVVLLVMADGQDTVKQEILQENNYIKERIFWHMLLEMDAPPPIKELPEGFSIRAHVAGQDDRTMHETMESAFADHWRHVPIDYDQWSHWNLDEDEFDPDLWFFATQADLIVGGLMAWATFNDEMDTGWVSDLGVLKDWRGRGIGEALLSHVFRAFYERDTKKVVLLVDTDGETGALHLYEKVGMKPLDAQFVYEKVVSPSE